MLATSIVALGQTVLAHTAHSSLQAGCLGVIKRRQAGGNSRQGECSLGQEGRLVPRGVLPCLRAAPRLCPVMSRRSGGWPPLRRSSTAVMLLASASGVANTEWRHAVGVTPAQGGRVLLVPYFMGAAAGQIPCSRTQGHTKSLVCMKLTSPARETCKAVRFMQQQRTDMLTATRQSPH